MHQRYQLDEIPEAVFATARSVDRYTDSIDRQYAMACALLDAAPKWQAIDTAPKDGTHLLLLTADGEHVEGWWDHLRINFYKSQRGSASFDPANASGEWVTMHPDQTGDN